jgi:site-specific recombinase XerD
MPERPITAISTSVQSRMTINQAIMGWLDEKRADSERTADAYQDTLNDFREMLHKAGLDLDSEPAIIAPLAQGWARARKHDGEIIPGETVTPTTFNQRRSIVSSFYKYALTYEVLQYNPMERVKRQKLGKKDAARHLASGTIKSGLAQIDRSTPEGKRDFALLSVALATGRRASEIVGLRYKHLHRDGNTCVVDFDNCKGKKSFTNRLEAKTTRALYTYLEAVYPGQLLTLPGDAPIWISFSDRNKGQAIGTRTLSNICEAYLGSSKTHAPRHTLAVTMHNKGAKITDISKALGHSSIAITSDYLEEQKDTAPPLPTQVYDDYWIWAERVDPDNYPQDTERCGKWMIWAHVNEVDQVWITIRDAVMGGLLGSSAKVATMMPSPIEVRRDHKVICIYTYDSEDRDDVLRILTSLREDLGILHKAFYKEDNVTLSMNYSFNTKGPVSKYWADYGEIALRIPKGR